MLRSSFACVQLVPASRIAGTDRAATAGKRRWFFRFPSAALILAALFGLASCGASAESDSQQLAKDAAATAELNRINAILSGNRAVTRIDLESLTNLREKYPNAPAVRKVLQGALIKRGDWAAAERVIEETPDSERTNSDRLNLAKIYFKQGKFGEASEVLTAISPGPDERLEVMSLLGQSRFYGGQSDEAVTSLEAVRAQLIEQKRGDDLAHLGLAYSRLGDNARARDTLLKAAEISPASLTAHSGLVRVHSALGDSAQAEVWSTKLRTLNDRIAADEKKKSRLVPLYYQLEDAYAAKDFDRVVKLVMKIQPDADDSTRAALYQYLAAAYRAQGKESEAQKALDDAARLTRR